MPRTVVFDLDGTLADTSADLIAAANACFELRGLGVPLDPARDAATAFRGARAMLRLGLERIGTPWSEVDVDAAYPLVLSAYADAIDVHTRLYPGAMEAVERLRAGGHKVGICTNKPEGLAETLLQRLGVRGHFGALIGADTLPVRKPDPAPLRETVARLGGDMGRATLIGDTVTDRETARAAGIPCILVTFGPDGDGVAGLVPEALLDHYDGLDAVLDTLLPA